MSRRVLVIGTTADYVDLIRRRFPRRALFLTDTAERRGAFEASPEDGEEILHDLLDQEGAAAALEGHLERRGVVPTGVACFDCESLELASAVAGRLGLPFHPLEPIRVSRSKLLSKRRWAAAGVPCPRAGSARHPVEAERLAAAVGGRVIVKPLTGAGSELVFACGTPGEAARALAAVQAGLAGHPNRRMYGAAADDGGLDPRRDVAVEELAEGPEFSCDFILDRAGARIIRVASKLLDPEGTVGTTLAYTVPAGGECGIAESDLAGVLSAGARALGFESGLFMVDFVSQGGRPCLLEMTPRPSGDCLPWLVLRSSGLDTLGIALDLAEGQAPRLDPRDGWRRLTGLRLFARRAGTVRRMGVEWLEREPRVVEVYLKRRSGHRVVLPPSDYDSRVLGHVVFEPSADLTLLEDCRAMERKFVLEMEGDP